MKLKVVTATKTLIETDNVSQVNVPGINGILGILPGHINLLTPLQSGQIVYKINGKEKLIAVMDGFVKVQEDEVMVLAGEADTPEDLVLEEIENAIKLAEDKIVDPSIEPAEFVKLEKQLRYEKFKKFTLEQSQS